MSEVRVHQGSLVSGARFADRYEIIELLGSGAFGEVYKAWHEELSRHVAIKLLKSDSLDAEGIARFEREAKALNALKHKNITSVYAFGVVDGAPYMVTEYVLGGTLRAKLLQRKQLYPKRVILLFMQLLDALQSAHAHGIVHRDLKPANIVMAKDTDGADQIKIIDFGLAKLLPGYGEDFAKLTETGLTVGTCHYMAPEQCQGLAIDARADIYAMGCIMYECLTGTMPFDARESLAVMYQHLNGKAKPISQFRNLYTSCEQQEALHHFIGNCMDKDRDKRYQSAQQALDDLKAIADGTPELVRRCANPFAPEEIQPTVTAQNTTNSSEWSQPSVFVGALCALVVAVIGALAYVDWFRLHGPPPAVPETHLESARPYSGMPPREKYQEAVRLYRESFDQAKKAESNSSLPTTKAVSVDEVIRSITRAAEAKDKREALAWYSVLTTKYPLPSPAEDGHDWQKCYEAVDRAGFKQIGLGLAVRNASQYWSNHFVGN